MTFKSDLRKGEVIELFVLELIKKKYPCAVKINGKFSGYDLFIPELHKSVEVKYDPMSNTTGNFVVEVYMYGKRSGLLSSIADYWVFYDNVSLTWIDREELMRYILSSGYKMKTITSRGDTQPKNVYLVNKKHLQKHIKHIKK